MITVYVRKIGDDKNTRRLSFARGAIPSRALIDVGITVDGNSAIVDLWQDSDGETFRFPVFGLTESGEPRYDTARTLYKALHSMEKALSVFIRQYDPDIEFA